MERYWFGGKAKAARKGRKGHAKVAEGILLGLMAVAAAGAQEKQVPKIVPVPPLPKPGARVAPKPPEEPTSPPAQTVTDSRTHVVFHLPPGWDLTRRDGEVSTFRLDARTAPRKSEVRAVASLAFNPYPRSTFSGAMFYLSAAPHTSAKSCAAETRVKPETPMASAVVGDVKFSRGKDEHGHICTESRDVAYTAMRGGRCLRFDLAINSFCGGEVSGAEDLTDAQLGSLFKRMEGILDTVQFTGK
jgi:hypothetical protein